MSEATSDFEHHGEGSDISTDATSPAPDTDAEPSSDDSGYNPAWNDLMNILPEGLHEVTKPHLQKWDKNVQELTQKVHSEYEPYKQYQQFVESKVDPAQLMQAHNLYQQMAANPKAIYDQLGEHFGFAGQGQTQAQQSDDAAVDLDSYDDAGDTPFNIENNPRFKQLQSQLESVTGHIQAQEQAKQQAESEAWVDQSMSQLKSKHGEALDEQVVLTFANSLMQQGVGPDKVFDMAADQYMNMVNKIAGSQTPRAGSTAPVVLSPGGGSPVAANPADFNPADRRAAMVAKLNLANKEN